MGNAIVADSNESKILSEGLKNAGSKLSLPNANLTPGCSSGATMSSWNEVTQATNKLQYTSSQISSLTQRDSEAVITVDTLLHSTDESLGSSLMA